MLQVMYNRALAEGFAADYIRLLRTLSKRHRIDDADEVKHILKALRRMSYESELAGRGELWMPEPDKRSGYFPIIEKVPYHAVRTMLRKNTSEEVREKARGIVAASTEPFLPLFARRPGTLDEAQRRSLLSHIMVSFPLVKGRYPALLGKKVPGDLDVMETGSRSVVPLHRMSPEEWTQRGFTMRKFSLSDDLAKSLRRRAQQKPRLIVPKMHPPKVRPKEMLKRAMEVKVHLEPENYKQQVIQRYGLTEAEYLCYEDGFGARLDELKLRAKQAKRLALRWVRNKLLPELARGAALGVTGLVQTEVGLGPTTVGHTPVSIMGLAGQFQPFSNMRLREIEKALQARLVAEPDLVIRKGLEKGLGQVVSELTSRRALV